jgi:carboxylesterase type B
LFLDVYAPSNATRDSKLPVFFFIQGGGFNSDANPNFNGSGLIKAADMDLVIVNFNYRVGPYGFLAGKEVQEGGSLNNGLKDQIKALQWVQKYIDQV